MGGMLGALVTGEVWLCRFSTLTENKTHQVRDKGNTTQIISLTVRTTMTDDGLGDVRMGFGLFFH